MCEQKIIYEWCKGKKYTERISTFLKEVDPVMIPKLSERVAVDEYAEKLACNADTVFAKNKYQDIAACSVYCNRGDAFVSSVAVKKAFWNQGVATGLLKETAIHAKEKKCLRIFLKVWSENIPAVKLYEKAGFSLASKEGEWSIMMMIIEGGAGDMSYMTLQEVRERIDKNYECIREIEKLVPEQKQEEQMLGMISLIGSMYSEFVTGVYSSEDLERYISNIGRKVRLSDRIKAPDNKILIVMSKASYTGGHTVLVHNWIKWDDTKQYSIAFTDSDDLDTPDFIRDAVDSSGGNIAYLRGDYLQKAEKLANLSEEFERIILFTHMNDIIPILAYSNPGWKIPIYFYNHADFRFSYGFRISDAVLNLGQFDVDKSIRYRGVKKNQSVYMQFPGMGEFEQEKDRIVINRDKLRKKINCKYGLKQNDKLVVSMGADFKYESIVGYEFDRYVKKIVESDRKSVFFIIGADKNRPKWKQLEKSTQGRARILGVLPREEADELICAADLYIVSFPMMSYGRKLADSMKIPSLCLNIIGRNVDTNDIRTADSVDELVEKTIDVLNGNEKKYLHTSQIEQWSKERWLKEWEKVCAAFPTHKIQEFHPQRHIEKQEYVNCQLMQETAGRAIAYYMSTHPVSKEVRQKIAELDERYEMGIFQRDIYESYNNAIGMADKNYKLYQTAIKWLRIKQSGKKIAQYLSWKGCHTVAIYGMGYMGQTLADELTDGNVKVLYGIDQNAGNLKWKIKICQPSDKIEPVDLIVNTTAIDNSIILHGMEEKNIPMAAFDELLDQILPYTHCIDGNNQIEREE